MLVQDDEKYVFFMFYSNNIFFVIYEKKLSREKISHQNSHPKVKWSDLYSLLLWNSICGVMDSVFVLSAVDRGF